MEGIIGTYGLGAVCVVLFLKGAGIPIPIPGDVLLLGTAAQAASGRFLLWPAFGAVLVAILLGGVVQFTFARGSGRRVVYRLGRYVGLNAARLDAAAGAVRRGGIGGIALLVMTPGLRSAAIPACGLAAVPWRIFVPGLVLGSTVDLALHFAIGFAGGQVLAGVFDSSVLPLIIGGVLVLLAATGLVGWLLLRRRKRTASAFEAWEQGACPVCLTLGLALAPSAGGSRVRVQS